MIDLEPPRAQVKAGRLALTNEMELVPVEGDVFHVVDRLKRIDAGLRLSFNTKDEVFVLQWKGTNDKGDLVEEFIGAYTELDSRLVNLVERLAARENRNRYELAKELDRIDAEKDAEAAHEFYEKQGPIAEKLQHAIRKDLGTQSRAFIP
jgi:hypothetical protein